jgi:transcription factor IIIB subunit 2
VLGSNYLKFVKLYRIENDIPLIDPSMFIDRFCAKLNFGSETKKITNTAIRLIQSMKRDWISTGRRPNGLCGAAILIAANIHDFDRSIHEIVNVVHVCDETIRKRIEEFKNTKTAQLTKEKFE